MNNPRAAWNAAYLTGNCAWNTGEPSPEILLRFEELRLGPSRVLDIGCGTGANAIVLAKQGHSVLGIDFAEEAIRRAIRHAELTGTDARFEVADFLETQFENSFDVVIDSGCYHSCRLSSRIRYLTNLYSALKPSGICISLIGNADDGQLWGPARVTAPEVIGEHDPFFVIRDLRRFWFDSTLPSMRPLGWSLVMERRRFPKDLLSLSSSDTWNRVARGGADEVVRSTFVENVEAILRRFSFGSASPLQFELSVKPGNTPNHLDLLVCYLTADRKTGLESVIRYEKSAAFGPDMSGQEMIRVVVANLIVVATHEVLESVLLDGELVFDPHALGRFMDSRYSELITLNPLR